MNSTPATGQVQPRRLLPAAPRVVFIGSGPGESSLMTMRGAEILATAVTVVYDADVHSEIVTAYVPQAATLIDAADLGVAASTRGRRLAELARPDNTVVRLSSDDGLIFTNTTAEAAVCRKADVEVEIVPGVGLSASTAAYTGTALTTNRVRSVRFIEAGPQTHVDVSRHRNTTHVLTGTATAHEQAIGALLADGWDEDTKVLLGWGISTIEQTSVETTLKQALSMTQTGSDRMVVIMGQGVESRGELSWFESKPLFGWQVLIPRTKEQGTSTAEALAELGAVGTVVPTIAVQPPRTPTQMEKAIRGLVDGSYEWVGSPRSTPCARCACGSRTSGSTPGRWPESRSRPSAVARRRPSSTGESPPIWFPTVSIRPAAWPRPGRNSSTTSTR